MKLLFAKFGLLARGVTYLILGFLTLLVVQGNHGDAYREIDHKSALMEVARKPYGYILLCLLAFGFASYAIWRLSEALWGGAVQGSGWSRLHSLARGLVYLFLTLTALSVLGGSKVRQSTQFRSYTDQLFLQPGGRWIVGGLGVGIAIFGMYSMKEARKNPSPKDLDLSSLSLHQRKMVFLMREIGAMARGFLFTVVGFIFLAAAWQRNTAEATGLDGALQRLHHLPFGDGLLAFLGLGMIAFGCYALLEVRLRRI